MIGLAHVALHGDVSVAGFWIGLGLGFGGWCIGMGLDRRRR
jgi:hypothetical protein